jgi:predicted AAA+ superfamily ATPase
MAVARVAEAQVKAALRAFRVTAIVGPRQVGKTTLARGLEGPGQRDYVTLDDLTALEAARTDPQSFIAGLRTPVTIDEIQRAPQLLLALKRRVDEEPRKGAFLVTGSADPTALAGVRDTLAGRLALVPLGPLTWSERQGRADWNLLTAALDAAHPADLSRAIPGAAPVTVLADEVAMGGFPEPALQLEAGDRPAWYGQFVRTYVERDVPAFVRPDDVTAFLRFVRLAASATAGLLNMADLARDAGISHDTSRRWLSVMESTFLVHLLRPFWRNLRKRLVKSPKLHVNDSGLAMALLGLTSWQAAAPHGLVGPLVESWVHQHLQVYASAAGAAVTLHHFRTAAGLECDFVVERAGRLLPIEVKTAQTLSARDAAGVNGFLDLFPARDAPFGLLLYPGSATVMMGARVLAVPMSVALGGHTAG